MFTSIERVIDMSDKNFGRRRRGMRFRPSGGLGHGDKPDREATQARAGAGRTQGAQERLFERRHTHEIERAETLAAGLPPEGTPEAATAHEEQKREFREPNLQTPAHVEEEKPFEQVEIREQPKGI